MTAALVIDIQVAATEAKIAKLMFALEPLALVGWMEAVVEPYIKTRAAARFKSEGDDASGKWAPLAQATIAIRTGGQIDYGSGPINHRTGALEDYITNSPGGYFVAEGEALMIYPGNAPSGSNETGSLEKKMIAAQQGLGTAPARPVIALSGADLAAVTTELEAYIMSFT